MALVWQGRLQVGALGLWANSRRRVGTAWSAESKTPSDVKIWMGPSRAPSARRDRTAADVRSEAWGEVAAVSGAAALR